jgi:hypothetical protein
MTHWTELAVRRFWLTMNFTLDNIRRNFDPTTFARGERYARDGKVLEVDWTGGSVRGEVSGSGVSVYQQTIRVTMGRHGAQFEGGCSCPMAYNCKHVVAVLLAGLTRSGVTPALGSSSTMRWLQQFALASATNAPAATEATPAKASHRMAYVLIPDPRSGQPSLHLCKARLRVDGAIASASVVTDTYTLLSFPPAYVQPHDELPARLHAAIRAGSHFDADAKPTGKLGAQLLGQLCDEHRLLWAATRADLKPGRLSPVLPGPVRQAAIGWRAHGGGDAVCARLVFEDGQPITHVFATEPAYYLHDGKLGKLTLPDGMSTIPIRELLALMAQAPVISAHERVSVTRQLIEQGLDRILPPPQPLQQSVRRDILPRPFLLLGSMATAAGHRAPRWHDYAVLAFDYDGSLARIEPGRPLQRPTPEGLELIERDGRAEQAACATLAALGFVAPPAVDSPLHALTDAMQLPTQGDWLGFARDDLPRLRASGWRVETTADYRFDLHEVDDWYAELADEGEGGSAWFDLELGIVVDGRRQPLLPLLVQLIRNAPDEFDATALAGHADADQLIAQLPDGMRVPLPWGRIKPILATLGELYFSDRIGSRLRLPLLDAARLAELEQGAQLRWLGGQRLRTLGKKLSQFGGVQQIAAPAGLHANLRDYQSAGLAWMQFLRAYEFGGILADDMGLGKTIQTLAHILVEKEAGRLDAPALVVAPTSLMSNWQAEAAKFAPGLRVLLLQGKDRLTQFDHIGGADIVLTTYALLARDEQALRKHRFHLLILDESQYIKNSRSKVAHTACLLNARHRLCLTGTPLQNHLGELWSQFHFLMPGLLGEEKTFNADFRKPIEKHGDSVRNGLLIRRVKPFMLRRTKDTVAKELPPKTEIVLPIELGSAQRDLYETVRLAMDKKVRAEIARKGVARSQIVILDALLKLRQVCCDPRLVKRVGLAKSAAGSAKLGALMDLVDTLLSEGRKILVFSQFTSMLELIAEELRSRSFDYAVLTGATIDRATPVAAFQLGQVPLFLISLKAGGVGLNLTAADTVIHFDPWWNPASENQATDRAWRIGQGKPVFVYKLIAQGTLEERIQEMQRRKGELASAVLAEGGALGLPIMQDDLQAIFAPW